MFVCELLYGIDRIEYVGVSPKAVVERPFCDTANAVAGGLFICLRGTRVDGHIFAREAVRRGAAAVVCERVIHGLPCIVVEDTRSAAAEIWNNYYRRPGEEMELFAVTGTCGKTTTATLLAACLESAGHKCGLIGTLGAYYGGELIESGGSEKRGELGNMTTPDPEYLYKWLRSLSDRGVTHCVMEVSSHGILQKKVYPLKFSFGIFTNLSPEHLDTHKTMEEYYKVKASFIEGCVRKILNGDDEYSKRLLDLRGAECVCLDMLSNVSCKREGISYSFEYKGESVCLKSPLMGEFNVYNTLMAAFCALEAGVEKKDVIRGIEGVRCVAGRLEKIADAMEWGFDVFIDYAHTPAAMEALLKAARRLCCGRLICVFGCGGDRDREKRPEMGAIAEKYSDIVIVTNDNPRGESALSIIRDVLKGMKKTNSVVILDRGEAVFCAVTTAREGDTVVLCGKGHEQYELWNGEKRAFSEKKLVREALKSRFGR